MAEPSQEALPSKTLFLKVSIHCEGCKKKVRRVLQNIDGVYKVEIDSFQHKVTVTGDVDHDTLIRRLLKSGKQASVWPEVKKPGGNHTPATSSNTKNQNKGSNTKPKDKEPKESSEDPKEKQPEPAKDKSSEKGNEKEEKEKPKNEDGTKSKPQEKEKEKEKDKENDVEKEKPKEKEKPQEKEKEKPKEQSEQEAAENSSGKKKKEKKEQKVNESNGKEGGQQVDRGISPSQPNPEFMYPYSYPYPPQPIMSYHMAQPSSSQAYYQQPPMPGMQGYMYPYLNPYPYQVPYSYGAPPESNYGTNESSMRGDDAMHYFNEENANSCSLM